MLEKITDSLFLRKQKKLLLREQIRLDEQYKITRQFPDYGSSEDENAQEVERIQENLGLQKNIKNLKKDIKNALLRIEKGNYWSCAECKGQIEQGRLKAYPAAHLCVTCASKKYRKK